MIHATSRPTAANARLPAFWRTLESTWPAYAAAAWAMIFGLMSFYWAIEVSRGRGASAEIISRHFVTLANERDAGFIAILWLTSVLKLVGGVIALSLVRPWGEIIPPWIRRWGAGIGGAGLALYGLINFAQGGLMQAGAIDTPADLGERALHWHLLVWNPIWLLGGLLYFIAAHQFGKSRATER